MVPFLLDVLFEHRSLTQELLPAVVEPLSEGHLGWIVGLLLCCGYGVYGGGGDGESLPNGAEIASMAVAGQFPIQGDCRCHVGFSKLGPLKTRKPMS